jgi:hypothetical protein
MSTSTGFSGTCGPIGIWIQRRMRTLSSSRCSRTAFSERSWPSVSGSRSISRRIASEGGSIAAVGTFSRLMNPLIHHIGSSGSISPGIGLPDPGRSVKAPRASAARICASTADWNWDGIVIPFIVPDGAGRRTRPLARSLPLRTTGCLPALSAMRSLHSTPCDL